MSSINKIILVGHLGKSPEFRTLENNIAVATFPLATSEMLVKNGVKSELTEWHNIVMWRALADCAARQLKKGQLVYIEGRIASRRFVDKSGIAKSTTEIIAEKFSLLGRAVNLESNLREMVATI